MCRCSCGSSWLGRSTPSSAIRGRVSPASGWGRPSSVCWRCCTTRGCGRAAGGQRGGLEPLPKAQPQCTVTETSGHYAGGSRRRTIRDRSYERDLVVRTPAPRQRDSDVPFRLVRGRGRAERLYLLRPQPAVGSQAPAVSLPLVHPATLDHAEPLGREVETWPWLAISHHAGKGADLQSFHHASEHGAHRRVAAVPV